MNGEIQVRECCERVWLACAIDSEGSIQVWRQPNSRANGETLTQKARAIPSEASGSTGSTEEPLETTRTSSASSNSAHECPGPQQHLKVVGG